MTPRDIWINETQMFQRIAGVPETSREDLGREWDMFKKSRRQREIESIKSHRAIQKVCRNG